LSLFKRDDSVSTKFSSLTFRIEAKSIFNSSLSKQSNLLGVLLSSLVLTETVPRTFLFLADGGDINEADIDAAEAGDNNDRLEAPSRDSGGGGDAAGVGEAIAGGDSLVLFLCNWCSFFLDNGRPLCLGCADGVITVDADADDTLTPNRPPFLFGAIPPILLLLLLLLLSLLLLLLLYLFQLDCTSCDVYNVR